MQLCLILLTFVWNWHKSLCGSMLNLCGCKIILLRLSWILFSLFVCLAEFFQFVMLDNCC